MMLRQNLLTRWAGNRTCLMHVSLIGQIFVTYLYWMYRGGFHIFSISDGIRVLQLNILGKILCSNVSLRNHEEIGYLISAGQPCQLTKLTIT